VISDGRGTASMGANGLRPASGGASYGLGELKRKAGRSFSLHVEASASEGAAEKTTAAEIDAGGRLQRAAAASSIKVQRRR
jgi:hypothetical protein